MVNLEKIIKRFIYTHECEMNPYYHINEDSILLDLSDENILRLKKVVGVNKSYTDIKVSIRYDIEYISRQDSKFRKFYNNEIKIDIDKIILEFRDSKLDEILNGLD